MEGVRGGLDGGDCSVDGACWELKGFGCFGWVEVEKGFEAWKVEVETETEKGFALPNFWF